MLGPFLLKREKIFQYLGMEIAVTEAYRAYEEGNAEAP